MNLDSNYKSSLVCLLVLFVSVFVSGQTTIEEFKGQVIDDNSRDELALVNLTVKNTNIATVTNSEGRFIIKIPRDKLNGILVVSSLGYATKEILISDLNTQDNVISLIPVTTQLSEVSLSAFRSAESLVRRVFENKTRNHQDNSVLMTAFYRETIKRRRRNVSLTEAVINLYKRTYISNSRDLIGMRKARKQTDYRRLDTVAVKLKGGPFTNIYLDILKYPEYIFYEGDYKDYSYEFAESTNIDGRSVYVVSFRGKGSLSIDYFGILYIEVNSLALLRAEYSMDLTDKRKTRNLLVDKKPASFVAYPTEARYRVDYKEKNGKWYYSYSSVHLTFKINKKRQLFNSVYTLSSELAVTDWENISSKFPNTIKNRLRPNMIISDEVSGFTDPEFWGAYNLIEPDKSIESAIEKIKRQLERSQD
jgi:hypothetical protein